MGAQLTNREILAQFEGASDFETRVLRAGEGKLYAYFVDGLVSGGFVAEYIFKPISQQLPAEVRLAYEAALRGEVYNAVARPCRDLADVLTKLVNGFCVVLFPDVGAIAFEVRTGVSRTPAPPEVENTVKGPKDAFVETLRINTSILRRHLRTPDLRICDVQVGVRSMTNVAVIWVRGITNETLVQRMRDRLSSINVDGFLSPSAVEEYVTGSRTTAFPLLQYTERADKFAQGLLDGRVGLMVDGLPLAYLAPADIQYLLESPEDRSRDYVSASCIRVLRYSALLLSLLLPGIYAAMAVFHQEMIPLPLLRAIVESKAAVPFSTAAEVLGLLVAFELLQESGIHLPRAVGQSVSTIGGIVVGTAAVEAGLISPAALIVVSIAGVCGFVLPNRDLAEAVRVWRFGIAAAGAVAGLFGVSVGVIVLVNHLCGLTCLGLPYLSASDSSQRPLLRWRLRFEKWRDLRLRPGDKRRQS